LPFFSEDFFHGKNSAVSPKASQFPKTFIECFM
jgi:hypothetical protein